MIILDSCTVLEILFAENDAVVLSTFLDNEQALGNEVVFLPLTQLERSTVISVRYKEGRVKRHGLTHYLDFLQEFATSGTPGDLTSAIIKEAARIKSEHAASMVDCYLMANAMARHAEILTSDGEILKYLPKRSRIRKVTKRFAAIRW